MIGIITAVIVQLKNPEAAAGSVADCLPRHQVGMMLGFGKQNLVSGLKIIHPPTGGNQIDPFGCRTRKHNLATVGIEESGHGFPGFFISGGGLFGQIIGAAMNVGIAGTVKIGHSIQHFLRFLRRSRRIQKSVGFVVNR